MEKDKVMELMNEVMKLLETTKTDDFIDKYVPQGSFDPELSPEFGEDDSVVPVEYKGYHFDLTRSGRLEYAGPGAENGISMGEVYWPAQRIFEAGQDEWNRHMEKTNVQDFDTFKDYVMENIHDYLGAKYTDADIMFKDMEKTGGVHYEGIIIRIDGELATPTLPLESYYDEYKKGNKGLSDVLRTIAEDRERLAAGEDIKAEKLTDFETVRGKIVPKLVNLETSKGYLMDKPYTKLNDMAVMYIAELGNDGRGSKMSMPINNSLLEAYGITKEELHDIAVKNINAQEANIRPLFDVIAEMTGEQIAELPAQMKMFVVTNQSMMFGAAMMLNDNAVQELADKMGGNGDFVIIPSSIHELLVLPVEGIEKSALDAMVLDVNRSVVDPMEQLSDHIYIYNAEAGEIQMPEVYYGEPVFDPERFSKEALSMVEWQAIKDASHRLQQDIGSSSHKVYRSGDTKILESFDMPVAFIHDDKLNIMGDLESVSNSVKSSITEFANKDAGYQKYDTYDDIINEISPVKEQAIKKDVQQTTKAQPKITPAARDMLFGNDQDRVI